MAEQANEDPGSLAEARPDSDRGQGVDAAPGDAVGAAAKESVNLADPADDAIATSGDAAPGGR